ncbi:hypothetical protein J2O09_04105 [Elizabethkingia anophelis]|uniref:hypothetical protein n=1 Tax=Elizabethkingia anophelis TaxID=1117645 RepID=UPI0020B6CA07|nr:hypothetical protein [Elizabethkingia anophelis]UTG62153.1 hypothetical protein J2O09_04105 [Elizabethkingia anophelis]UXM68422.1 hypothetical protein N7E57_04110 [Elizabethkingia anophelis]
MKFLLFNTSRLAFLLIIFAFCNFKSQVYPIGQILAPMYGLSWTMYNNGVVVQDGNPFNWGQSMHDPTGIMYLILPSALPYQKAYFVDYDSKVIELDYNFGYKVIGYATIPVPPRPPLPLPPAIQDIYEIETPNGTFPVGILDLPYQIVDMKKPYGNIMIASADSAVDCYKNAGGNDNNLDKEKFGDCMVSNMAGKKELAAYKCARDVDDDYEQTLCLVSSLGGNKEKQLSQDLLKCYKEYSNDYSMYPLCFTDKIADPDLRLLVSCMRNQTSKGQITFMDTAICYGASKFNLNSEAQIAVKCAVATKGQPYAFVACAGGQLSAKELERCFTHGVGGDDGCFGKNNTIIDYFTSLDKLILGQLPGNNDAIKLWNQTMKDIKKGPGKNHEVVNGIRNIANEIGRAPNNVGDAIKKVVPKVRVKVKF